MTEANVVLAALLGAAVVVPVAGQERHASHFDGPKPAQSVVTDYPPIAVAACVQGTASIVVELDQDGRVTGTDFISGSPLFEEAAVEASRRWRFESGATPGRRRQVLQFSFGIVPRKAPKKAATSFFRTPTAVEVRRYWGPGGTCSDCSREASIRMAREEERRCAG
jgi:TonB family protein